jgi:hypothetical protein
MFFRTTGRAGRNWPDALNRVWSSNGHCANGQTNRPDALLNWPDTPIAQYREPVKQRPDVPQAMAGRDSVSIRLESSKLPQRPDASDRVWPDAPRVRSALRHALQYWVPDRTRRSREWLDALVANPNTRAPDCYVELTGRVRSNHDRVRCSVRSPLWPPFPSVSFLTSGVVENRHFKSSKTPESRARKLGGRERETQTLSTAQTSTPSQMCQHQ